MEFSLEGHGHQVCIEPGDRVPNGLGWPEYVERICLDGSELYWMFVMETEEFGVLYYSVVGTLDGDSENFLMDHAALGER